jgi:predicted Rossmann-fold nucleotide-binding protein
MAAVSAGAKAAGGKVVGCTLGWFGETRVPGSHLDEIEEAPDLHARIDNLLRGVRGAVVLPGGVGTMNELFWVWTLLLFDRDPAPEALVLLGEPWEELIATLRRKFEFPEPIMGLIRVASDAEEAAEIACGVGDEV